MQTRKPRVTPPPRSCLTSRSGESRVCNITVDQLCEHFEQRELRCGDSFRSFATVKTYRRYMRKWIRPHLGSAYLDEIKAVEVESWLRQLPMARSSRAKIRSILSILFNHACRYELFDRNPIRFVRQGAKRRNAPDVLTAAEIKALVDHLPLREHTLVLLAASTGLRQSELFGLKWRDIDFLDGELSVVRSIVFGVVGRCKTESSQKPVKEARKCYLAAGLEHKWEGLALEIRRDHSRKSSFMPGFNAIISGESAPRQASFLDRARWRWAAKTKV